VDSLGKTKELARTKANVAVRMRVEERKKAMKGKNGQIDRERRFLPLSLCFEHGGENVYVNGV
jgi:hypothetical protein